MLCLSGFELCSRWVPLFLDEVGGKRFLRTLRGDTVATLSSCPHARVRNSGSLL